MKGQIKSGLLGLVVAAFLTGIAIPSGSQAEVKVTVLAAEYNDATLVASVVAVANDGEDPNDWQVALSVTHPGGAVSAINGTIEEDLIFERLGIRLWKIVKRADVIEPLDTLTAIVAGASDSASCGRGLPRLRITAICK